jgi:hypothetical protein
MHAAEGALFRLVVAAPLLEDPQPTLEAAFDHAMGTLLLHMAVDALGRDEPFAAGEGAGDHALHALHRFMHLHIAGAEQSPAPKLTEDIPMGTLFLEVAFELVGGQLQERTLVGAGDEPLRAVHRLVVGPIPCCELRSAPDW